MFERLRLTILNPQKSDGCTISLFYVFTLEALWFNIHNIYSIYFCFIQEVCQAVQQLNPRLVALSSAMKRLGECRQLEEEVANLKKQQQEFMGKATEKQSTVESLLALWQR